jgi:hypothetical protein
MYEHPACSGIWAKDDCQWPHAPRLRHLPCRKDQVQMSIKRKPVPAKKKRATKVAKVASLPKAVYLPPAQVRPKSLLAMAFEMHDRGEAPDMPLRIPKVASKPRAWRKEDYRRLVSMLPCSVVGCCAEPPSQAAHRNQGKGMGVKVTDAWLFSACAEHHTALDQGPTLTNEQRRQMIDTAILRTFAMLLNRGWLFTATPTEAGSILPLPVPELTPEERLDLTEQRAHGGRA